jgi:tRNA/tmRNA/rRNA uracil-C5-methylase (TrmA/RlmC/RlmD family)
VTLSCSADGSTSATWVGLPSAVITERAVGREFDVAADGFWQPHLDAADVLAQAVRQSLDGFGLVGGTGWDLYGGVGLFAEVLCRLVGPDGSVISVESDERASQLATVNLARHPQAIIRTGRVEDVLVGLGATADVILLDPPRTGAGPALCQAMADRSPQVIVYVACDPAALGRDTAALGAAGYRLDALRAFDAFPQTQHVECVARFVRA